jgi:hypothetical protein
MNGHDDGDSAHLIPEDSKLHTRRLENLKSHGFSRISSVSPATAVAVTTTVLQEDGGLMPADSAGNIQLSDVDYLATWREMEKCVHMGLTRSIGLSNFNSQQIDRLLANAKVKPVNLQVIVMVLPEMSLLTGPSESTGGCPRSLLTGPSESTGGCQSALVDKLGVSLCQYHHTIMHIAITRG